MSLLEAFGWAGSLLVVVSLTLANAVRFRVLNLAGCLIATAYNVVLGIWPYAAMNVAISAVNIYWLVRMRRQRSAIRVYRLLEVAPDAPYLAHLVDTHREEIERYYPGFDSSGTVEGRTAYLALEGELVAGIVLLRHEADDTIRIDVDYSLPTHRDLSLGRFLYGLEGLATGTGTRFLAPGADHPSNDYFTAIGFTGDAENLVLTTSN